MAAAVPLPTALNPRRWWSLVAICAVTALVWITASDISIALPTIGRELGGSMDTLQWAVNGYFLTGSLIIVGGRLGDIFGRRRVFAFGTVCVLVGSVATGIATSPELLIIGRLIQGVGAAAILPTALAIVAVSFEGKQKDTAIGAWITTCWGAQALGPLVGGLLIASLSWQWLFWMNLPIGIVALVAMWMTTPESAEAGADRHVDLIGLVTLVGGLFLISYGLVMTDTLGARALGAIFGGAIVVLGLFVFVERRVRSPLVDLRIFKQRMFDGAVLSNLIANFTFGAVVFFMALHLQVVEGKTALAAGALLLPATIPILLLNPIGTRLGQKVGPWLPTAVGMALLGIAAFLLTELSSGYAQLLLPFVLIGAGIGLQITPCATVAMRDTGGVGEGTASGVFKASSMIGGSLGVAAGTAVFQLTVRRDLSSELDRLGIPADKAGELLDVITGSRTIQSLTDLDLGQATDIVHSAFNLGLAHAMWPSILTAALGVVIALLLLKGRIPDEES